MAKHLTTLRCLQRFLVNDTLINNAGRGLFACQHRKYSGDKFSTAIPEFENHPSIHSYTDLYNYSLSNSDEFWSTLATSRLKWFKDFQKVQDCDMEKGKISWFLDGKLNVSGNEHHHD